MDINVARHLFRLTRAYSWAVPSLAILSLLAALAEGLGIGLMIPLLDTILGDSSSMPAGLLAKLMQQVGTVVARENRLVLLGGAVLALVAVKTVILVTNAAMATRITGRITYDLRVQLSMQLLKVGYRYFAGREQGRLMNTFEAQTYRIGEALAHLVNMISAAFTVAAILLLLLLLSWQLTLIVAAIVLPVSFLVLRLNRRAHQLGQSLVDAYAKLSGRMMELLTAMRTIRLLNQENAEQSRIATAADRVRKLFVKTELLSASIPAVLEFLYLPVFLAVLGYAVYTNVGVPSLLVFIALLYRMQPQLKILDQARVALGTYAGGIEQVTNLLREDDKPYTTSGRTRFQGLQRAIEFDGVSFGYAGIESPVVREICFTISKGDVVAIVGGSGAGKSTLIGLLCRLYDPQRGTIRADGMPLAELELRSWRERLAFAGQDSELLDGTVRENILYGAPQAGDADVVAAARLAHAEEFISALPNGYDTEVGPRGTNLSGGQRQRIALARALIRKPDFLILDEATNAVDNLTELAIQETINQLAGPCTILIVAHRLSTIRNANYVLVMAGGRIVEQGRPDEMLKRGGEFFKLHQLE